MLTLKQLEDQRKKLLVSQEAYEKNLDVANQTVVKFTDELKRHEGAIWAIDQLIVMTSEQPAEKAEQV